MTQTNGLDVLFAWCGFLALLAVLAYLVLRRHSDPRTEAHQPEAGASDGDVGESRDGDLPASRDGDLPGADR